MIVFLYGRDSYRLKQNLDKIIAEYRKKNTGMSFSVLDFSSDAPKQLEKLTDLIKTVSFFEEKRLIVLKNAFLAGEKIAGLMVDWKLDLDKQRILVLAENSEEKELSKKDKKLLNLLSARPNIVKSFEPLVGKRLENWLKEEIESLGGKIDPMALKKLASCATSPAARNENPDPAVIWRLKQEIDKLVNYKLATGGGSAKNNPISTADVELLVGPNASLNIFEIVDAITDKNQRKATRTLYNHLETGADPYYIFSMIVYQFRNLLRVKTLIKNALPYAGIVKKTGLHPYVVKKTLDQCKNFDLEELKRLFDQLARLDIDAKSGRTDMAEGLYQFVYSLNISAIS